MTLMKLGASLAVAALTLAGCGALVDTRATKREALAEQSFPPEGAFLTVNDRQVHYVQMGQGPDLVLIHGASGNTRDWTFSFLDRVKDRYRVTIFDRPGLGYTDRISIDGASSPQEQAALLSAAADQLGVRDEVVLGHSYGGAVAMAWILNHDPKAAVILSGATMPWPGGLGPLYTITASRTGGALFVPLLTAYTGDGIVRRVANSVFRPQEAPEGYVDYIGAPLTLRRDSFNANARQITSLRPALVEMSKSYGDIDIPVEILHGSEDVVVPGEIHAVPLSRLIPGSNLFGLEGVGHMPHHILPQAVEEAIDRAAFRAGLR